MSAAALPAPGPRRAAERTPPRSGGRDVLEQPVSAALRGDEIAALVILLAAAISLRGRIADASALLAVHRMLWWVIYAAVAAMLVRRGGMQWIGWTVRRQTALSVLVALCLLSSLWSLDPALTLHKSASLAGTTLAGVYIGIVCAPHGLVRVLFWTFAILIVASIAVSLVLEAPIGPGIPDGWRGVTGHKNALGIIAACATVLFAIVTVRRLVPRHWGVALCAASVVTLAGSRSRTALAALAVMLGAVAYLAAAWGTHRTGATAWRRFSAGLVGAVSILPFVIAPLFAPPADDPLNGRARLWAAATTIARERPLTGYGYAAVWGRKNASQLAHVPITAHRSATSAHNSIVQVVTELGIPAAIVAALYLVSTLANAGRLFACQPSAFSALAVLLLLGITVAGFSEAHLLAIHWSIWILFVALSIAVRRALDRHDRDGAAMDGGVGP